MNILYMNMQRGIFLFIKTLFSSIQTTW